MSMLLAFLGSPEAVERFRRQQAERLRRELDRLRFPFIWERAERSEAAEIASLLRQLLARRDSDGHKR